MKKTSMLVAGVMSGTSGDGINVALVRIGGGGRSQRRAGERRGVHPTPGLHLVAHAEFPYPAKVRRQILASMNAAQASVPDLSRLNFLLGELYAEALLAAQRRLKVKIDLIGCHGQTLYHQGQARRFLGRKIAPTWQTGESAVIAARVGAPVISDFRPADMAAGGQGAPLVPYLDYLWFRHPRLGRIAQNIGGIANLTAIPAGAAPSQVSAFDTGPGNMVMDAVSEKLLGIPFDRDGKVAASGKVIAGIVERILRGPFFRARPPKTAGREEFGREFVREFLALCQGARKPDVICTATFLTARSIADAVKRWVLASPTAAKANFCEIIVSGGGAKNRTLVAMLADVLAPSGIRVRFSDDFGLPSQAKEAVAFALLAFETWNRRPANVPSATGAARPAILGKISYA
jgi:anhydro-N-acetylmuramic acid kinase